MRENIKSEFPIFLENPWLVYLDNAATTQKPAYVIDWVSDFVRKYYANIHRWFYSLSEKSEELYENSKSVIAKNIWWKMSEIIYTYNATYALNILALSLARSWKLKKWDKILLNIVEHHANIVPWLILKEQYWIEIEYVKLNENYDLDMEDFKNKYDESVKLVSMTRVSNVTWTIYDIKWVWELLREDTLFVIDASQAVPNFKIDVCEINADFVVFTWHKHMAYTGIWVLWWRKKLIKELVPWLWWWWSIKDVDEQSVKFLTTSEWFEPWTPNIIWAVSIKLSFEFIKKLWYDNVFRKEKELTKYALEKFNSISNLVSIVWKRTEDNRLWVFSFNIDGVSNSKLWEIMSEDNICIRCWWHCAHPYFKSIWMNWSCRMSLYFYNDFEDIDRFFDKIKMIIK